MSEGEEDPIMGSGESKQRNDGELNPSFIHAYGDSVITETTLIGESNPDIIYKKPQTTNTYNEHDEENKYNGQINKDDDAADEDRPASRSTTDFTETSDRKRTEGDENNYCSEVKKVENAKKAPENFLKDQNVDSETGNLGPDGKTKLTQHEKKEQHAVRTTHHSQNLPAVPERKIIDATVYFSDQESDNYCVNDKVNTELLVDTNSEKKVTFDGPQNADPLVASLPSAGYKKVKYRYDSATQVGLCLDFEEEYSTLSNSDIEANIDNKVDPLSVDTLAKVQEWEGVAEKQDLELKEKGDDSEPKQGKTESKIDVDGTNTVDPKVETAVQENTVNKKRTSIEEQSLRGHAAEKPKVLELQEKQEVMEPITVTIKESETIRQTSEIVVQETLSFETKKCTVVERLNEEVQHFTLPESTDQPGNTVKESLFENIEQFTFAGATSCKDNVVKESLVENIEIYPTAMQNDPKFLVVKETQNYYERNNVKINNIKALTEDIKLSDVNLNAQPIVTNVKNELLESEQTEQKQKTVAEIRPNTATFVSPDVLNNQNRTTQTYETLSNDNNVDQLRKSVLLADDRHDEKRDESDFPENMQEKEQVKEENQVKEHVPDKEQALRSGFIRDNADMNQVAVGYVRQNDRLTPTNVGYLYRGKISNDNAYVKVNPAYVEDETEINKAKEETTNKDEKDASENLASSNTGVNTGDSKTEVKNICDSTEVSIQNQVSSILK